MSWSLVNRALELFDADLPESRGHKSSGEGRAAGVGTKRHGVRRAAKQKQREQQRRSQAKKQLIQKQVVSALEEYKKRANTDHTITSLKLLRKIDRKKAPEQYINQITEHHTKELERKGGKRDETLESSKGGKKKRKPEEKSVFSDEDFDKLNKEWLRLY